MVCKRDILVFFKSAYLAHEPYDARLFAGGFFYDYALFIKDVLLPRHYHLLKRAGRAVFPYSGIEIFHESGWVIHGDGRLDHNDARSSNCQSLGKTGKTLGKVLLFYADVSSLKTAPETPALGEFTHLAV